MARAQLLLSHFFAPLMIFQAASAQPLFPRYVPPSMYIDGAKLSGKIIALIVILVLVTVTLSTCTCYICYRRHRSRSHRRRLAAEAASSTTLKPRINKRNAKFFAPGLFRESKREREEQERRDIEMQMRVKYGIAERVDEIRKPERTHLDVRSVWRKITRGEPIAGEAKADERLRGFAY